MTDAVIVAYARTPIGRAYKGSLVGLDAFALAEIAVGEVLRRSGIDDADVDDIVLAESLQGGGVIARHTAIRLGLLSVPGLADNRHCAAGPQAVQIAAASIIAGMDDVIVAGGTESLTNSPVTTRRSRSTGELSAWMSPSHPETPDAPAWDMSITVGENTARAAGLSRHDVDEWAALSHERAIASIDAGWFRDEIVPVTIACDGTTGCFDTDEHPRRGTSIEKLAALALLHPEIEGATVTAGNAAGLNDAAAAVVVTSGDYAAAHGVPALGRIRSWASVGVEPALTGMAPIDAIPRAIARRACANRHRAVRDQRSVLLGAGRGISRVGHRPRHPERQRQWLQSRSPDCRDRYAHGDHDAGRAGAARCAIWMRLDVCRRRHGFGDDPREALIMAMLDGRVAVITGAGAGIGRGVALAFADEGATIVAAGRTQSTLETLCAEVADRGARALPVVCDVRELDDISRCIDRTIAEFGRLDILVNNAQTYRHSFLLDATEEDFDTTWRSGPLAAFRSMRLAHPHLSKNNGVIVNFGSGVQLDSSESFHGVYAAAKNAIEALTRSLRSSGAPTASARC